MPLGRFGFALVTWLLLGTLVLAQGPFVNPYLVGGVKWNRGRWAVGVGFVKPLPPPFAPPFVGGVVYERVNQIALVSPPPVVMQPPIIIINNNNPPPLEREPQGMQPPLQRVLPAVPELPPLPDIPPVPEVPPVPNIPPLPGEGPPPVPPQELLPLPPPPVPPSPPREKPKPKPQPKPIEADDSEPRLPQREPPAADPRDEAQRLVQRGRAEFAVGEYGRAAQRFRRAAALDPADTTTPFLLVQALLAMAKYAEASDLLIAALKRRPDWPRTAFRPYDLHHAAGDYAQTLEALEATRRRHPDEALLQFLAAYSRWLDGRRDEAQELFRRLRASGFAAAAVEPFLQALPDVGPL